MPKLVQTLALISQGEGVVTSVPGGVPVISIRSDTPSDEVAMVASFLRSGCSAVQLLATRHLQKAGTANFVRNVLVGLELPGETFEFGGTVLEDGQATYGYTFSVWTITRRVT